MTGIKIISVYAVPFIFILILLSGFLKGVKVYDQFVEGASDGIKTLVRILPSLVGLLVAISIFRASGALDLFVYIVSPVTKLLGIPAEILPLAFLRPISGSASLALVADMMKQFGPDSYIGRVASTMMGSTETIFYTLAVYYGAVGIKNIRYTIVAALIAEACSIFASVWICKLFFGN